SRRRARSRAARRGPCAHRRVRGLGRLARARRGAAARGAAAGRPLPRRAQRDAAAGRPRRPAGAAGRRHRRHRDGPRGTARGAHLRALRHRGAGTAGPRGQRDPRPAPGDDLHRHPGGPRPPDRVPDGHHRRPRSAPRRRGARGGARRRVGGDRRGRPAALPRGPGPCRQPSRRPRRPGARGPLPTRDRRARRVPAPAAGRGAGRIPPPRVEGADRPRRARGRRHRRRAPRRARGPRCDRGAGGAGRRRRHLSRPRARGPGPCATPRGDPGEDPGTAGGPAAEEGRGMTQDTPARARTRLVTTRSALREEREAMTGTVAAVLTMGALHDGHLALVRRARELADHVILTDFVNPLQFGPGEDYEAYPRTLEADLALVDGLVDVVFAPAVREMYPVLPPTVSVTAGRAGTILEGAARPGHFDGVVTVVAKLLQLTRPHLSVFGRKDAQQLAIIQRLVADLDLPVRIEPVEIQREPSGLARSSRNAYLGPS